MIVSPKVLISKKPEENVQSEDKQCKTLSPGSERADSKSTHQDELARIAPSVSNELDLSPNLAAYENDFDFDDWEGSSDVVTVTDSQPSFATKSDIKRLEAKQELLLENQSQIMETLTGISNLLKEKAKKRGILRVNEPSSGTSSAKSMKIIERPVPILHSTPLSSSVEVSTFVESDISDEYLQGQESISGGSLESEPAKSRSPVPVDFTIKQHISETSLGKHISETSLGNTNPKNKKKEKAPLTAEEQKVRTENKACLKDLCDMVGTSYSKPELAESSYEGGKRKYNGREFEKKGLSPGRMKKILKSVSQKHPEAYARLKDTTELREAVNMKCRKSRIVICKSVMKEISKYGIILVIYFQL